MSIGDLKFKVDKILCNLSCLDAREAKYGRISTENRELLVRLSLGRIYLDRWNSEQVEEFRCWVFETF